MELFSIDQNIAKVIISVAPSNNITMEETDSLGLRKSVADAYRVFDDMIM